MTLRGRGLVSMDTITNRLSNELMRCRALREGIETFTEKKETVRLEVRVCAGIMDSLFENDIYLNLG